MFLKWLRKDEQGSIMVIVAVAMVALLGFAGLAVDYGSMAMTKQELQNAADAAALAAGQDRMNGLPQATANATADSFIRANGYHPGDGVTVSTITHGSDTVTVEIQTQKKVALSGALTGRNTTTISAKAVAEVTTAFGEFPYALFAGETMEEGGSGIEVGGNNIYVYGNMHSNTKIRMKKASCIGGLATAVDSIEIASGETAKTLVIDMPRADGIINMVKNGGNTFFIDGNVKIKGDYNDFEALIEAAMKDRTIGPEGLNIYINGSLTISGNGKSEYINKDIPVNLVVRDSITNNGTILSSYETSPMIMVAEKGGIEINGGGAGFYGIVFAPEGDVTINGNDAEIHGSIIAKNITKNGGKITVKYNSNVDNFLPQGKVRLIA